MAESSYFPRAHVKTQKCRFLFCFKEMGSALLHKLKENMSFQLCSWLFDTLGARVQTTDTTDIISARPRSAEYTRGMYFETAKNTKAFE